MTLFETAIGPRVLHSYQIEEGYKVEVVETRHPACWPARGKRRGTMSDQPTTLYPEGFIGIVNFVRPCCDCRNQSVSWMSGVRCQDCHMTFMDREQGAHWADHVLRMVETVPEFRERMRAALGVAP